MGFSQLETWPELEFESWKESCLTLQLWLQIVGKIKISKTPWINHAWHCAFHLTARGLTTSVIHDRDHSFEIRFDFIAHELQISASDGRQESFPLAGETVASFHDRCLGALKKLDIDVRIHEIANELPDLILLNKDTVHGSYDPDYVHRFWRILLQVERLMRVFRASFIGKVSPIHLFWGAMDLAVTRFSGRLAPSHPGGIPHLPDRVTREAYSHEVSSCGFWPGNTFQFPHAAFYSYAYPAPRGFSSAAILPSEAAWHEDLGEFILPYESVRQASDPERTILHFFQSTYEAAADLAKWDRERLEKTPFSNPIQGSTRDFTHTER